jgi:hypothetical protein
VERLRFFCCFLLLELRGAFVPASSWFYALPYTSIPMMNKEQVARFDKQRNAETVPEKSVAMSSVF